MNFLVITSLFRFPFYNMSPCESALFPLNHHYSVEKLSCLSNPQWHFYIRPCAPFLSFLASSSQSKNTRQRDDGLLEVPHQEAQKVCPVSARQWVHSHPTVQYNAAEWSSEDSQSPQCPSVSPALSPLHDQHRGTSWGNNKAIDCEHNKWKVKRKPRQSWRWGWGELVEYYSDASNGYKVKLLLSLWEG